jgi:hypothetical protein
VGVMLLWCVCLCVCTVEDGKVYTPIKIANKKERERYLLMLLRIPENFLIALRMNGV